MAAHEGSLEYVFPFRAADTLLPVCQVILEEVDAITGIDSIWGETGPAASEWDCDFFDAPSGTEPAVQRQAHHQLKPSPSGPGLQRPA